MCLTNSEMDIGKCITCLDVQIIISNVRYKGVKKGNGVVSDKTNILSVYKIKIKAMIRR